MVSFIPEDIIQRIQDLADIRQIVSEYVPLKKRGNNWVGLCPFHHDRDPSFTVNEDKQIFHCFGCGVGGGVFKFLMLIEGMSFVDAVKALADRYGVTIPEKAPSAVHSARKIKRELLLECMNKAMEFFHQNLVGSRLGVVAREYLEDRGISDATINHFKLGWAPHGWENLVKFLKKASLDLDVAREAGLIIRRDGGGGYYDRFRARVVFPIHDRRGHIVAFGGRVIGDGDPKYINSPESPIYQKKECLYGYFLNKSYIRKEGVGIVVEGYMDLVALFEHGITNVVATLGTALTEQHARLMKGLTKDWILVFDADEAGFKAASRALPILYSLGLRPKVLSLPEGHDPDTFIRSEGRVAWNRLLDSADQGIDFVLKMASETYGSGPEARMEATEEILKMINGIEDPVRKSLLISHASQKLGIKESILMDRVFSSRTPTTKKKTQVRDIGTRSLESAPAQLVSFILNNPHRIEEFLDVGFDYWLEDGTLRDLWLSMVHAHEIYGALEIERFVEYISSCEEVRKLAKKLIEASPPLEDSDETIRRLKTYCLSMKNRELRRRLIEQLRDDEANAEMILRRIEELH
ncbi:DNA primase [Dissulfuribacter thermophilus]|uniref:DNA primase n=1 Tax=Dissulfuribacter thermophilus TaxID=1156395 RepID=A0A1B9F8S6_9BACT|nr:DNA primase [Dissulfuribacter thermophilus]OCC16337.1 DNA primase [Dissulfuribacter thermophilus]